MLRRRHQQLPKVHQSIGPTEMAMPGSTGIELKPHGVGDELDNQWDTPELILPT